MLNFLDRDIKNLEGIRATLESEGGAFSSEEQEAAFDRLNLSVPENLEALGLYIKDVDSQAEGIKSEMDRLAKKKKSLERASRRSRELIIKGLLSLDWRTIRSRLFSASLVKSKKVLPVEIDIACLPDKYILTRQAISIDLRMVLADAKAGFLDGIVELLDSNVGLRIF